MTELTLIGFRQLHGSAWACNVCDHLPFHDTKEELVKHLKKKHKITEVEFDADGGAWISKTTHERSRDLAPPNPRSCGKCSCR